MFIDNEWNDLSLSNTLGFFWSVSCILVDYLSDAQQSWKDWLLLEAYQHIEGTRKLLPNEKDMHYYDEKIHEHPKVVHGKVLNVKQKQNRQYARVIIHIVASLFRIEYKQTPWSWPWDID